MKITRNRMDRRLVQALESYFEHTPHPTSHQIKMLSRKHSYNRSNIYKWFWKKRKMTGTRNNLVIHRRGRHRSQSRSSSEPEEEPDSDVSTSQASANNVDTTSLQPHSNVESDFTSRPGNPWDALPESSNGNLETNGPFISCSSVSRVKKSMHSQSSTMVVQSQSQLQSVSSTDMPNYAQAFLPSQLNLDDIFEPLTSREISVLEKVYALVPNPSSDDIAKLASRFVKEKQKEEEIQAWFLRRQNEQSSVLNNQEEMQFEIYNYNN